MGVNDAEVFWEDLLSHIRQQVLIPVVGPDLTVVNVGDAEQTLTTIVGQRLAERYQLTVPPGATTGDAVAAFLQERGPDELERLYRVINDIITDLDPAPGDSLRDLATINDLRLFVSTTPDRLLTKAVNEVRFKGSPRTRELSFSRISRLVSSRRTPNRPRRPTLSFSICSVRPPRHPNTPSTMRTGWSGYTRC